MKAIMSIVQYLGVGTLTLGILAGCSRKAEVPTVVGLNLEAATAKLKEKGLVVGKLDSDTGGPETTPGTVLRQEPVAGQPLDKGGAVGLVMDNTVLVPDFKGMDFVQANRLATTLGIMLQPESGSLKKGMIPNSIIEQDPPAGRMPTNSLVRIVIAGAKKGGVDGFFETVDKAIDTATGAVEKADSAAAKGRDTYNSTKTIVDKYKAPPKPDRKPATNAEPPTPAPPKNPVKTSRVWLDSCEPASPATFASNRMVRVRFGYATAETGGVSVTVIPFHKGLPVQTDPNPVARKFPRAADRGAINFALKQAGTIDEVHLELRSLQNPAVVLCEARESVTFKVAAIKTAADGKDQKGKGTPPSPPKAGVAQR